MDQISTFEVPKLKVHPSQGMVSFVIFDKLSVLVNLHDANCS